MIRGAGDDTLEGGNADDILFGGPGQDQLDGGDGIDLLFEGWGRCWWVGWQADAQFMVVSLTAHRTSSNVRSLPPPQRTSVGIKQRMHHRRASGCGQAGVVQ